MNFLVALISPTKVPPKSVEIIKGNKLFKTYIVWISPS